MVRSDRFIFAALLLVGCAADSSTTPTEQATEQATDERGSSSLSREDLHARLRDPIVTAQLRVLSTGVSARLGVASPLTLHAVAAFDHQAAETVISGAEIGDHVPVFVVQATGGPFTADHAPPGGTAPIGSVLTVSYDAETLAVTDIGLDDTAPDLQKIDAEQIDLMAREQ